MFTQALDKDGLRWVRQGGAAKNRDFFGVTMAARQTLEPIPSLRNAGLPPSAKFPNGRLSSNVIQGSQRIPVSGYDHGSESDMDMSSDSDEHVYDGHYSFISSPQDDKVRNGVTAKLAASVQKSEAHGHGGTQLKLANGAQRPAQVCGRKQETGEEQFSDSACSTEVSYMQHRSNNGVASHREAYSSDGYSSTVTSRVGIAMNFQDAKAFLVSVVQCLVMPELFKHSVKTRF